MLRGEKKAGTLAELEMLPQGLPVLVIPLPSSQSQQHSSMSSSVQVMGPTGSCRLHPEPYARFLTV